MPEEVLIDRDIISIDPWDKTRLSATSFHKRSKSAIIYEGGIGEFEDLLYRDEVILARTSEGWFFSKDKGRSWMNEAEYEKEDPEFFDRPDRLYGSMGRVLYELLEKNAELVKQEDMILQEWIETDYKQRVQLLETRDEQELKMLRKELIHCLAEKKYTNFLYLYAKENEHEIGHFVYNILTTGEKVNKDVLLNRIENESTFVKDFGIAKLYQFNDFIQSSSMIFTYDTVIIEDLQLFFKREDEPDFVESTLNLLLELSFSYSKRFIVLSNSSEVNQSNNQRMIRTFRKKRFDRFWIKRPAENEPLRIQYYDGPSAHT